LPFFLNAISPESYILKPSRLQINPHVEEFLLMAHVLLVGFILLWSAIYIKKPSVEVKGGYMLGYILLPFFYPRLISGYS